MVAAGCGNNSPENGQLLAKSGDGVLDRHMSASTEPRPAAAHLQGWDCIEFWVGNARTTAGLPDVGVRLPLHRLRRARDRACGRRRATCWSRVTSASWCRGALEADSPIADARAQARRRRARPRLAGRRRRRRPTTAALARGARSVREPWIEPTSTATLELAQVATYGDTVHTFVNRVRYRGTARAGLRGRPAAQPDRRAAGRAGRRSTTSSATSSRASSTTGSTSTAT